MRNNEAENEPSNVFLCDGGSQAGVAPDGVGSDRMVSEVSFDNSPFMGACDFDFFGIYTRISGTTAWSETQDAAGNYIPIATATLCDSAVTVFPPDATRSLLERTERCIDLGIISSRSQMML